MESVIVVSPHPLSFSRLLDPAVATSINGDGTVVVERDGERVYISECASIRAEFESEPLASLLAMVAANHFYAIDFSDISLCKHVLLATCDNAALVVDNDHGVMMPGDRFAQRLRDLPDWDWRLE